MKQATAQKILQQTKETYNSIASDFNATRGYLWPGFDKFLAYVPKNSQVLDVGCGNGRLVELFAHHAVTYTGIDASEGQVTWARKNHPVGRFMVGDTLQLPFPDASFDAVFMIAVLHHIPSRALRQRALQEVRRVLKPGGVFIMTNWDYFNRTFERKIIAQFTIRKIFGKSELDFKDILKPWAHSGLSRYCHCFTMGEMRRAVAAVGFAVKESFYTAKRGRNAERNLVVIARKR
ncbi:MAG: class I SAM-dependent methyltransferase [Patescibacteria group bacterium]|nr:class I SAM-dependent methyltransferase [Patescibacteria group bacterium]